MVCGCGDADNVIAEFKREFTLAKILLMLPACHIREGCQTRKPLGNLVDVIPVLFKELKAGPPIEKPGVVDLIIPSDLKRKFLTRKQRLD